METNILSDKLENISENESKNLTSDLEANEANNEDEDDIFNNKVSKHLNSSENNSNLETNYISDKNEQSAVSDEFDELITENNVSNESDDETIIRKEQQFNKKRLTMAILDSESEDDDLTKGETNCINVENEQNKTSNFDKLLNEKNENDDEIVIRNEQTNKKRRTILDSDSEEENYEKENENEDLEESVKDLIIPREEQIENKRNRIMQLCDSDNEEDKLKESINNELDNEIFDNRYKKLCDSESSAEETERDNHFESQIKKLVQKRKQSQQTEKKMTAKKALEQRREIQSESQKMIRESRVYLPYHRPKQHNLKDFLKRRSVLSEVKAPPNTPTTFAIKISSKQFEKVKNKLTEREKEIEHFYISDEEESTGTLNIEAKNPEESNVDQNINEVATEKKIEVVQQNSESVIENSEPIEKCTEINSQMETETTQQNTESITENCDKVNSQNTKDKVEIESEAQINNEESNKNENSEMETETVQQNLEQITENCSEINSEVETESVQKNCKPIIETSAEINPQMETETVQQNPEPIIENCDEVNLQNKKDKVEIETETQINNEESNKDEEEINEMLIRELKEILQETLPNQHPPEPESDSPQKLAEEDVIDDLELINGSKSTKQKKELTMADQKLEMLKKLNPVIALKNNFQPRLSGNPNEIIDLTEDVDKSKKVNNLMHRFLRHVSKKPKQINKELSIVNVSNGIVNTETINLIEDSEQEPVKAMQTPGVRIKKLKSNLEQEIILRRLEELQKRQEMQKLVNEEEDVYTGENSECGEKDILDDEEEIELTDTDPSSDEEDEEDMEVPEIATIKSAFVDDEAEESDFQDDQEENEDETNNEEEEEESDEDEESEIENNDEINTTNKPLKRIIKPFTEDSEDETDKTVSETFKRLNKSITSDNDEDIPAYQKQCEITPCKTMQNKSDFTKFISPTLQLTALQGINSATKFLQESPGLNIILPPEPSPLKSVIKTKLFTEQETMEESTMNDLENLCSGKFLSATCENKSESVSNQKELLDDCSSDFINLKSNEIKKTIISTQLPSTMNLIKDATENFELTIENESINVSNQDIETETQEINAQEIPNTSTFEEKEEENQTVTLASNSVSKYAKMVIASSSEEENKENATGSKKKKLKKKRKKYIVDDVSISDDDENKLEDDFYSEEDEEREVYYDSEENEIELEASEVTKEAPKINDYFENEAVLSGSEWGSDDEDEKDLDDFEVEDGDSEKLNQKKIQRELERIHVRNILDDDQREVKLLQELLLEDGELHGSGRERKFRWKNADSLSWNEEKRQNDDEEIEEQESELEWRKRRHEREMFLKEQQEKAQNKVLEDDSNTKYSQIMKLGEAALRKSLPLSQWQRKTPITEEVAKNDDIKLPFTLINKRGSFLARSETVLTRIAEITRTTTGNLNNGPKNSKNFVFTSVEKTELVEEMKIERKRKAEEGTPKPLKKLRIVDMSPKIQSRKRKL